ncbi:MAG: hypothetical protein ACKV2T_06910 [Kofleriaceae bacterium]
MSYRNDHDAALHRVAVLERELATLRGETKQKREDGEDDGDVRAREYGGEDQLMRVLVGSAAAILCVVGLAWRVTSQETAPEVDEHDVPMVTPAPIATPPAPSLVSSNPRSLFLVEESAASR